MKKGSNRAAALLQEILLDQELLDFVEKKRVEVGIPSQGFKTDEAFIAWLTPSRSVDWDKYWKILDHIFLFADLNSRIPFEGVIDGDNFKGALQHFVLWNRTDVEDTTQEMNSLLFENFLVLGGKKLPPKTIEERWGPKNIVDGMYLRISPSASVEDIKDYIDINKERIKKLQKIYLDEKGLVKPILKYRPALSRDIKILELMNLDANNLKKLSSVNSPANKQEMVSEILFKQGIGNLSPDAVKKAYNRLRKARSKKPLISARHRHFQGDN